MNAMPRKASPRPYPDNLPGVPLAMLARLNGISERQARRLRAQADPAAAQAFLSNITPALALTLSKARVPGGHLSHWTRLAMAHHRQEGLSNAEIASFLKVSLRSVGRVLGKLKLGGRGFNPLSGGRVLSSSQRRCAVIGEPEPSASGGACDRNLPKKSGIVTR